MNYQRIHDQIILNAQSKNRKKGLGFYYESHHIIPKCLGGLDYKENRVLLTAKEHFVIHKILVKIYPKNKSIGYGLFSMAYLINENTHKRIKLSSREYESIKWHVNGENNVNYGGKITKRPEVREKISKKNKGKIISKLTRDRISKSINELFLIKENRDKCSCHGKKNGMYKKYVIDIWIEKYGEEKANKLWKERSIKFSKKMSGKGNPMFGKSVYSTWVEKYGIEWSDKRKELENDKRKNTWKEREESRRKISESSKRLKGIKHKRIACPHCKKEGGISAMHRYHFDNCKYK